MDNLDDDTTETEYGKKTVLVIDDDITVLTAIRKILETTYDVCLAKSAEMAWAVLSNTNIDLLLLDQEMPSVTGLAFMEYLQGKTPLYYMPVIFVTSHSSPDVLKKAMASGAKGFIVKPVSADILLNKVSTVIENFSPQSSNDILQKQLNKLAIACKNGRSVEAEKLTIGLQRLKLKISTVIDRSVVDICIDVRKLDFASALEKISDVRTSLLRLKAESE